MKDIEHSRWVAELLYHDDWETIRLCHYLAGATDAEVESRHLEYVLSARERLTREFGAGFATKVCGEASEDGR